MKKTLLALSLCLAFKVSAATITVDLQPSNILSGNATTAGWAANITNTTSMWVLFNSVQNSGSLAPFSPADFHDLLDRKSTRLNSSH